MDVLSDVLDTIRLQSAVFVQTELEPPWGIHAAASDTFAFHIVTRGRCWLSVDGRPAERVSAGDVLLLNRGRSHTLTDAPETPARPIPGATGLTCGCFRYDGAGSTLLMAALPIVIHTGTLGGELGPWLAQTVQLLAYESRRDHPGNETVVNRLCDALFVYLVRGHLQALRDGGPNWLRALIDPQVGVALRSIHEEPSAPWTVATLAARAAMSRSAFAARFAELVGETPMQYLIRWRLEKAARMLRDGGDGIAQVAARVGYDSEAAFNKAFKRSIGVAPGAYRRAARAATG
jgi:AraC-like DNA-binding protein